MGLQFHSKLQEGNKYKPNMNRFFALFAFVATALAEPEADPQILLASAHATGGLVKHLNGAVTPDDTLSVKVAKAQHLAAKGLAYGAFAPYAYAPYAYAPYTYAVPHTVAKREAEADAEADPQFFYNGFYNGYAGYNYALPYAAYSHVATAPVVTKTEVKQVEPATVKYAAAPYTYAYAAPYTYSHPYASYALPAAYHTIAKREAEPEADPALLYSNYYGHPGYRYSAYRYPYYSAY